MKAIFRNFKHVITRFKTSSLLNLLGLSAAFLVFVVCVIQVKYDLSYDTCYKNTDKIFTFYRFSEHDQEKYFNISTSIGQDWFEQCAEIEDYALLDNGGRMSDFDILDNGLKRTFNLKILQVSAGFEKVFTPEVIAGNVTEALKEDALKNVILTESAAKKLFGDESPLGKIIFPHNQAIPLTVAAVIKDYPENSSVSAGIYLRLLDNNPTNYNYIGYYLVNTSDGQKIEDRLNDGSLYSEEQKAYLAEHPDQKYQVKMTSISNIHLHEPDIGRGSLVTTMSLLAIGLIALFIAYINFVNFSLAVAPARMKTLNIQKIIGASKWSQRLVMVSESALFSLGAFLISLLYLSLVKYTPISGMFTADLTFASNSIFLLLVALFACVIGLFVGMYPAYYVTNFDPVMALKGSTSRSGRQSMLRKSLIVFQYVAAIVLVIVTLFIYVQLDYVRKYDWGIEKENILYMPIDTYDGADYLKVDKRKPFIEELEQNPQIIDCAASQFVPGDVQMSWGRNMKGKQVQMKSWPVSSNYLDFFGFKMLSGRNFSEFASNNQHKVIVNQKFLDKYEFTFDDVLGEKISCVDTLVEVIGVMEDVNFESLKNEIEPMILISFNEEVRQVMMFMYVKVSTDDMPATMKHIESVWAKYSDDPIDLHFLDKKLDDLYQNEENQATLIGIFAIIAILIAIMGVYGLITFNSKYRAKEIAIRKVQGSSDGEIMLMLNKGMLIQLAIGFVIACPLAYYIVDKWLDEFAYRTTIHWWIFALSGLLVLLITLVTVSVQSYRAATSNPINALRNE